MGSEETGSVPLTSGEKVEAKVAERLRKLSGSVDASYDTILTEYIKYIDEYRMKKEDAMNLVKSEMAQLDKVESRVNDRPDLVDYSAPSDIPPEDRARCDDPLKVGYSLQGESEYVAYCLKCKPHGGSWAGFATEAEKRWPELNRASDAPNWTKAAWKADGVYYIGHTSDLQQRLCGHMSGKMDSDMVVRRPSRLTAISFIREVMIVGRFNNRSDARRAEEEAARKFATPGNERFVYQA